MLWSATSSARKNAHSSAEILEKAWNVPMFAPARQHVTDHRSDVHAIQLLRPIVQLVCCVWLDRLSVALLLLLLAGVQLMQVVLPARCLLARLCSRFHGQPSLSVVRSLGHRA